MLRFLTGLLLDFTQTLKEGEFFFKSSGRDPAFKDHHGRESHVLLGDALIYRYPCKLPSDTQKVSGVSFKGAVSHHSLSGKGLMFSSSTIWSTLLCFRPKEIAVQQTCLLEVCLLLMGCSFFPDAIWQGIMTVIKPPSSSRIRL